MEKTTKKRKKSKRLRRRIGLIAVGGLSFVLTICLSVGATLAWFAGSTWASNDLYMGGPVYVEMAGRGHSGATTGTGTNEGKWVGGDGQLDIIASARNTGTAGGSSYTANNQYTGTTDTKYDTSDVLLPGQKLLIYSQARVYSTAYYNDLSSGEYPNVSSGANTTNTTNGTTKYTNSSGIKKTTTTSVLRAKFSINIEFDPTVGFNNYTDTVYVDGYPEQSQAYTGDGNTYVSYDQNKGFSGSSMSWVGALSGQTATLKTDASGYTKTYNVSGYSGTLKMYDGRRDAVENPTTGKSGHSGSYIAKVWNDGSTEDYRWDIKNGLSTSIYKWKYVSEKEYEKASSDAKMGAPFNGDYNSLGEASANNKGTGNGYYGLWVLDGNQKQESDAFYKARCNAYILSYQEHYKDHTGQNLNLNIKEQLSILEDAFNEKFEEKVHESSDNILKGLVNGFTANSTGETNYKPATTSSLSASWLYVNPSIGNDTNAADSATDLGGWWYLVETANLESVTSGKNEVKTVIDNVLKADKSDAGVTDYNQTTGTMTYDWANNKNGVYNSPVEGNNIVRKKLAKGTSGYTLNSMIIDDDDTRILTAKLYEITPTAENGVVEEIGTNSGTYKVVSESFPFVNGHFEVPGKEVTNIFSNVKISFQITFQALQAFFPFSNSIDGCASGSALAGTGKALNIGNAIPIFNEAFDYLGYLSNL